MAKKRQATPPQPLELEKTLLVDNQEYNVNAVHATQVDSNLIINQVGIEGTSTPTVFNGSTETEISIVPSSGGTFSGPIRAQSARNVTEGSTIKDDAVLNYGDFNNVILKSLINNSILYTWSGSAGEISPTTDPSNNSIKGISLVTGTESDLNTTNTGFAAKNANITNQWLPAYLYICTDSGNIYFGTSSSSRATRLATSNLETMSVVGIVGTATKAYTANDISQIETSVASAHSNISETNANVEKIKNGTTKVAKAEHAGTADTADIADKLSTSRTLGVSLASSNTPSFDGSANITIGVSGTLPVAKGGTGSTDPVSACNTIVTGNNIQPNNVTVNAEQYVKNSAYGLNLRNSDILGTNSIFFCDYMNAADEGIFFPNNSSIAGANLNEVSSYSNASMHWDRIYAAGGKLYFVPNTGLDSAVNTRTVYHTGNIYTKSSAPVNTEGENGDICIVI